MKYFARRIQKLDGLWDFAFADHCDTPENPRWNELVFADKISVPGVFDTLPPTAGRRGTGFYRTCVEIVQDGTVEIRLGGLGLWGAIFWDRKLVGVDDLPYSGMSFSCETSAGEHELIIAVDNRLDFKRTPLFSQFYDYYGHGGIYRSVEIHELPQLSIDRALIRTVSLQTGEIAAKLLFHGNPGKTAKLGFAIDGDEFQTIEVAVAEGVAEFYAIVKNPKPWSPESPCLHRICVKLDNGCAIEETFGLRTIEARKGELLLNGKPLTLHGVCRHETHPQFGPALPTQLLAEDIAWLKELGCNFVRGSHYPQDQRFLELCDQYGILVWEEGIGWGDRDNHFSDPGFCSGQLRQLPLMVKNSYNHPCVILWGFLNEGDSSSQLARPFYASMAKELRRLDPTRPITYASMFFEKDIDFDLVDVIGINAYPGWYAEDRDKVRPLEDIAPRLDRFTAFLKENHFDDKPLILSEIGAGGIYGWRDRMRSFWSEEYQSEYLAEVCRYLETHPRFCGVALWQYCDGRTYQSGYALGRPRAFNNKGLLDEYRRPKTAFETVREYFHKSQK